MTDKQFTSEEAAKPEGWRPIETAPKDGEPILLYAPAQTFQGQPVGERVTVGAWTEWEETASEYHGTTGEYLGRSVQDGGACWMSWDGGFTEECPPTHWMQLPAAPGAAPAAPSASVGGEDTEYEQRMRAYLSSRGLPAQAIEANIKIAREATHPHASVGGGKPVAFHDKDQPEGIAWCPGFPEALRDISPLYTHPSPDQEVMRGALAEMKRYAPILERLADAGWLWDDFAGGLGIATTNGYRAAIASLESALKEKP